MKVTYIYPPLFKEFYPIATRVITENLLRNKNLEVTFSDIPVKVYTSNIHRKIYNGLIESAEKQFSDTAQLFLKQRYIINNIFYVFMNHGYYNPYIVDGYDNKYIIFTCINFCDLIIVRNLLEANKKVLLGGALINIGLSTYFLRDFLYKMGVDESILQNNLIIVSGNIDLTTDIYAIIKSWKDTEIRKNNYGTICDCRRDFLNDFYNNKSSIPVHFAFNNTCWYGKCKFCTYKKLPKADFLINTDVESVVDYIRDMMDRFGSDHIRLIDSYFNLSSGIGREVLEEVRDYDITIYSGIRLLKNIDYIFFLNRYVNCILIGLESTSDFSLNYINKGYRYHDVEDALEKIIQYLDRRVFLEISVILDLPERSEAELKKNYRKLLSIKQRLSRAGFRVGIHMNILSVFPNLELLLGQDARLRISQIREDMDVSSGKNYLIHMLRQAGMDKPLLLPSEILLEDTHCSKDLHYGYISSDVPVVRYERDGHVLPSDLNLIDKHTMQALLMRDSR